MNKQISFFSLCLLIFSAVVNMKNMPATALFGSSLLFFFVVSLIFFLIPTTLISSFLSAADSEKGGIYDWVHKAFGPRVAMTAVWFQWSNTMVWFPSMLSFIAGTIAYAISPSLIENKLYLTGCTLIIFWGITWINLKGVKASSRLVNFSSWIGTLLPMILLIGLGAVWGIKGSQIQFSSRLSDMLPSFSNIDNWSALVAVMASFLGIELSGVHVNAIDQPQKNLPKALCISALCIFLALSLTSLSIAAVIPKENIHLLAGVMQAFQSFFNVFGLGNLIPILACAIALGSVGTMVNWLIAPAKGLFQASEAGFLPSFFLKKNKNGIASNVLLVQALLVTLFSFFFLFQSSANEIFWLLTALSTELYMIMYILMFASALKLHRQSSNSIFKISKKWIWIGCSFGLIGCITTICVSFLPPQNLEVYLLRYISMAILGNLIAICPLFFSFLYQKRKRIISIEV